MPEPFKRFFNGLLVENMALHLTRASAAVGAPPFDAPLFLAEASRGLEALELKARSAQIERALVRTLPGDFPLACRVIRASLHPGDPDAASPAPTDEGGIAGWGAMPLTQFVASRGLDHFDLAMDLLRTLTSRFSAEFAIRTFIRADQDRALSTLATWVDDASAHVRRLVSEGTRPRLPWAMQLPAFIRDPSPTLALLERLRDDPSATVRRSVANHLNDIAKDHPDRVADLAAEWLEGASEAREKLVRHACRTLLKQGHPGALKAFGFRPPDVALTTFSVGTPVVDLGGALEFHVVLGSRAPTEQNLMLDYVIHHRKANGSTSPKVFKWKVLTLARGDRHQASRRHPIKPITTRAYYGGTHFVELQVNGRSMGRQSFELRV